MANNYLKMVASCLGNKCKNYGALRKDIWSYISKEYAEHINYNDFLIAMNTLLNDGKLIRNINGYFKVEYEVYEELH